jgi:DNA-binding GntR family transcriptional regulator
VREALQRLIREGLIEVRSRRGYVAAPITIKDVQEIFQQRLLLEPAAAEQAALRATDQQLEQLKQLAIEHGDHHAGRGHVRGESFHRVLAQVCGSRRLNVALQALMDETARVFNALALHGGVLVPPQAHGELVEALLRRDGRRARELRQRDIRAAQKAVIEALLSERSSVTLQLVTP